MKEIKGEKAGFRIALVATYDGTDFSGFQLQNNARTVQGVLEEALLQLYHSPCRIYGCSRTDAGVHALEHISHADVPFIIPEEKIPLAINPLLPNDVAIQKAAYVSRDFHARFMAKGKQYIYRIWNAPVRPVVGGQYLAHVPAPLDREAMAAAAHFFEGEHDFSAFCAAGGLHVPPIRHMETVTVEYEEKNPEIRIVVKGESFLYNMVRIIAGTLVYVGLGKLNEQEIPELLHKKDRRLAGKTMQSKGLTLVKVYYEPSMI